MFIRTFDELLNGTGSLDKTCKYQQAFGDTTTGCYTEVGKTIITRWQSYFYLLKPY